MRFATDGRDGYITTDDVLAATYAQLSARIALKADEAMISATNPTFSAAVNAAAETTVRREVSSSLNTYIDGETGVEYVGKFYSGSLYYVPTGNVYPPNK